MKWMDIVLLVLITGYSAYITFVKKKKQCSGNCGSCVGCSTKKKI